MRAYAYFVALISMYTVKAFTQSSRIVYRRHGARAGLLASRRECRSALHSQTSTVEAEVSANEEFDIPTFVPTTPSGPAVKSIEERQLGHRVTCEGISRNLCKHGHPQAFVFHPSKKSFQSGLFRLSCPLLVKAVDEYENAGGLEEFNFKLERSPEMQKEFRRVNARHSKIRKDMVRPQDIASYIENMGQAKVDQILDSGIAGVSPEKQDDLKCLHAHLADYLCTGDNLIGKEVYETLQRRKIEVEGIDECYQQCDTNFEPTQGSWWYVPQKNKQRLRQKHRRRASSKAEARADARNKAHEQALANENEVTF